MQEPLCIGGGSTTALLPLLWSRLSGSSGTRMFLMAPLYYCYFLNWGLIKLTSGTTLQVPPFKLRMSKIDPLFCDLPTGGKLCHFASFLITENWKWSLFSLEPCRQTVAILPNWSRYRARYSIKTGTSKILIALYLQYILQQPENSLIRRMFEAEKKSPTKGDWVTNVTNLVSKCKLGISMEEIKSMPNNTFSGTNWFYLITQGKTY